VGFIVAALHFSSALTSRAVNRKTLVGADDLSQAAQCVAAALAAGVAAEFLAFVCLLSISNAPYVETHGFWIEVSFSSRVASRAATPAQTIVVLFPSIVAALAGSTAAAFRRLSAQPFYYALSVAATNAIILSILPVILLIVMIVRLPKARGLEHEWLGLWPLAAVLYFVVFALIGGTCGALAASISIGIQRINRSRTGAATLWLIAIVTVFLAEAVVRGWPAHIFGSGNNSG
jgi:hypothetical protein